MRPIDVLLLTNVSAALLTFLLWQVAMVKGCL
ncbi:hypothetical protein OKW49_002813 [Paraburkholderia youngii]